MTGLSQAPSAATSPDRLAGAVDRLLLVASVAALVGGLLLVAVGQPAAGHAVWAAITAAVGVRLAVSIVLDLVRREAGVDVIALLAIVGALLFGEVLAGSVIALMLTTGVALEAYAEGRATRELSALLSRAPRVVHRYEGNLLQTRPVEDVAVGDRLLVKPGEVVPVDGLVMDAPATLDESALTGESRLVVRDDGDQVSSGVVNAGSPFDLHATATAETSTYAGIVRLVREAQREKAPSVRLADRYAVLFVPLTLAIAGSAWLLSGDPVRGLAVLVVATPCPLLLSVPIAIVAGISRAARRGIIVKGGGALETLARARVLLFDKTGTLTAGRPHLAEILAPELGEDEVLRLAASVDQVSPHVLAAAIVHAARGRGLALDFPADAVEDAGAGITGTVGGRRVAVGTAEFASGGGALAGWARDVRRRATIEGTTNVFVAVDGQLVGALVLDDPIRPETPRAIRSIRRAGVGRIVMVTGDSYAVAEMVGAAIGVDGVLAERTPSDKVEAVKSERADAGGPIVLVGDGLNDAPALALADVGVAMGARGATASSEAADIVIVVDRLDRLAEAIRLAQRSRSIALQSVVAGMGMSIAAMIVAAFGFLPVVAGAVLQEVIDVVVILNALRALRGGTEAKIRVPGWTETSAHLRDEHHDLNPEIGRIRSVADRLDAMAPTEAAAQLRAVRGFLVDELLPHEELEDRSIFPMLSQAMGNDDALAALHRTHREIFHLVRLFARLVDDLPDSGPVADDLPDLRRVLYGLYAILRLHMEQEEELYLALGDEHPAAEPATPGRAAA